ncbi:hypothetical protein ACO0LD_26000 [Undibacterium sp. Ji83W]
MIELGSMVFLLKDEFISESFSGTRDPSDGYAACSVAFLGNAKLG